MKYFAILTLILLSGCGGDLPPEKHVDKESGTEWEVEIEVILKSGGTAKLVCPKFSEQPVGAHGRECYLREYDLTTPLTHSNQTNTDA